MGNRVRYLKPRQSHGTTSNFQRNLHPAAIPFIVISLPFQESSTVCRSPSQEPRYRKMNLLSKALPFPICNKENRGILQLLSSSLFKWGAVSDNVTVSDSSNRVRCRDSMSWMSIKDVPHVLRPKPSSLAPK